MWNDINLKFYIILVVIAGYDFILFTSWGIYIWFLDRRKMSTIFWLIDGIFFMAMVIGISNAYIRIIYFIDIDRYKEQVSSGWFAYRHIPLLVILLLIGFFMTRRWILTKFFDRRINRRMNGRRETDHTDV